MLKEIRNLIADAIRGTEFESKTWLAGGCVRDELLGKKTNDIDIAVELPDGGTRLAEYLHERGVASQPVVYRQFGTALVSIAGNKVEFVMTRRESYRSRCRKPDVQFGSLEEDVLRRDFTINSLIMNVADGKIADLSGLGKADLKAKLVRSTSDPAVIFREDPLRLLRAVRFAAQLKFGIETKTWRQIRQHVQAIKHVSRERSADEIMKIMALPNFLQGIELLIRSGLKAALLPGLKYPPALLDPDLLKSKDAQYTLIKPAISRLSVPARLALGLWLHDDMTKYLQLLKLSAKTIRHVTLLAEECKRVRSLEDGGLLLKPQEFRTEAWKLRDCFDEFILLYPFTGIFSGLGDYMWKRDLEICQLLKRAYKQVQANRFNLTGQDLMRRFCLKSGPLIGDLLSEAFRIWTVNPSSSKEELLDYLRGQLAHMKKRRERKGR